MKKLILCGACHRPLWAIRLVAGGQPIEIPARPEVPPFHAGVDSCPFCNQSIFLHGAQGKRFYVRDEEEGRIRTEAVA